MDYNYFDSAVFRLKPGITKEQFLAEINSFEKKYLKLQPAFVCLVTKTLENEEWDVYVEWHQNSEENRPANPFCMSPVTSAFLSLINRRTIKSTSLLIF